MMDGTEETLDLSGDVPQVGSGDIIVLDIETVAVGWSPPENEPDKMPPIWAWRIVCMGWVHMLTNRKPVGIGSIVGPDEYNLLVSVSDMMKHSPKIVTFNGRKFDLPVIQMACLRNSIPMPWFFGHGGPRYRYGENHIDLYDQLSVYGACAPGSLDKIATSINLPGKSGVDGSSVEVLYREHRIDELRSYCESDVAQTAILYLEWEHLRGNLSWDRRDNKRTRMVDMWNFRKENFQKRGV